jgi:hypothetical protein
MGPETTHDRAHKDNQQITALLWKVWWRSTDDSEEHNASLFKVKE